MSGGRDLLGVESAPRKRGRPKGSTNRRAKDLKGLFDARYGGSAAQQSAQLCMVTPAELKAAGGSMARAQVAKAMTIVTAVRQAQDGLDDALRLVVKSALAELAADLPGTQGSELRDLVKTFIHRVKEGSSGFGLAQAMKMIADERAALLPYTDQRQPLAVEVAGQAAPAVIVMGGGLQQHQVQDRSTDIAGEFRVLDGEVAPLKSHDESQAVEDAGLFAPRATD
jgi:hypothetical protein